MTQGERSGDQGARVSDRLQELCRGDKWFAPHHKRYIRVWEELPPDLGDVVDVGGASPMLTVLQEAGVHSSLRSTGESELRVPFGCSLPGTCPESADVILCLEVLEHMHDVETNSPEHRHQFEYSGMTRLLHACLHTLRRGGRLLLTTPNVHSSASFRRLAQGKCPYMYPPHVRELSQHELTSLLQQCGYEILSLTSYDVWDRHGMSDSEAFRCAIVPSYDPDVQRGDDFFVWCRRP